MNFTSLEYFAMDKLQCGTSDLCMLDNVYSTLGEECYNAEDLVDYSEDLNDLLYHAYTSIMAKVQEYILDMLEDEKD